MTPEEAPCEVPIPAEAFALCDCPYELLVPTELLNQDDIEVELLEEVPCEIDVPCDVDVPCVNDSEVP